MRDWTGEVGHWAPVVAAFQQEPWCQQLMEQVGEGYGKTPAILPPREDLFTALRLTGPESVRCVILGQDPYPTPGHAHGLAFSVRPGVGIPRSLQNMYRELESDLNLPRPESGSLTGWAEQGVLLLNNVLTVYEGAANSHKGWGWERFTARLLLTLRQEPRPIAFLLWGKNAQTKGREAAILTSVYPRLVLETAHPSPLSARRGFFGSRPYSRVNAFLEANGQKAIDWQRV